MAKKETENATEVATENPKTGEIITVKIPSGYRYKIYSVDLDNAKVDFIEERAFKERPKQADIEEEYGIKQAMLKRLETVTETYTVDREQFLAIATKKESK